MVISESDLPGVGTKFEIDLGEDEQLVVIIHNNGKREVFRRERADADSEKLFEISDQQARKVGSILEGAFFQPIATENAEELLTEGSAIEWYTVDAGSELDGQTLGEARVGERTGVSVLTVDSDEETPSVPAAETWIEAGDTVVVQGSQEDLERFESLVVDTDGS